MCHYAWMCSANHHQFSSLVWLWTFICKNSFLKRVICSPSQDISEQNNTSSHQTVKIIHWLCCFPVKNFCKWSSLFLDQQRSGSIWHNMSNSCSNNKIFSIKKEVKTFRRITASIFASFIEQDEIRSERTVEYFWICGCNPVINFSWRFNILSKNNWLNIKWSELSYGNSWVN